MKKNTRFEKSDKVIKGIEDKQKQNKVIWKDTYRIADKYPHTNAKKINQISEVPLHAISCDESDVQKVIKVFNEDLITTIEAVVQANFKPLVLINANDNYPIESVRHGLESSECDLYRCSNISSVINDTLYPLRELEMIYCPKLTMFKTRENKILSSPYQFSLVLSTPVRRPTLISIRSGDTMEDTYCNPSEEEKMRNKIENIFKLAVTEGFNCLLLMDFGCQAESNPINKIIEFFNEFIEKYSVKYVFFYVKMETDPFNHSKKVKEPNFEKFHENIKR